MPSAAEHLAKAEHNEQFSRWLLEARLEYYDWVLTGAFYAAVHYVEAVLAVRHHHSRSHAEREFGLGTRMALAALGRPRPLRSV